MYQNGDNKMTKETCEKIKEKLQEYEKFFKEIGHSKEELAYWAKCFNQHKLPVDFVYIIGQDSEGETMVSSGISTDIIFTNYDTALDYVSTLGGKQ